MFAWDALSDFAYSTVATAPSPASSGVSLTLASGDGANFPSVFPFYVIDWATGANPLKTNAEIMKVTARSGDVLTIVRAQEGTSARTIVVGDQIALCVVKRNLTQIQANVDSLTDPLGALSVTANQPIPTSIVDWATNGTNYAVVAGANKLFVTTDPTDASKWVSVSGTAPPLVSVCRVSGIGYVGVAGSANINNVWINANEDGKSWVVQDVVLPFTPACIRTDGTTLVICGSTVSYPVTAAAAGQIWTSTDGVTWTQRTSNAGNNSLNWLAYNATWGGFVAVGAGSTVVTSPTGTTWTSRSGAAVNNAARVEIKPDGSRAVVVGNANGNGVYYSTAIGNSWQNMSINQNVTLTGLAVTNSTILVTTSIGEAFYTTDNGTNWRRFGGASINGVCFGNSNYFIATSKGVLAGSALDALTPYYDQQNAASWNCCVYHTGSGIFLSAGNSGLLTSYNNSTFAGTSRTSGFGSSNIQAGIYDPVSATVGFVGAGGKVFWSLNGTTLYTATTGTQATQLNAICTDASQATNKFLCVGNSGVITTLNAAFVASTTQTSGITNNLFGCASNGAGTYVAVGTNCIGHSTDGGVTWTWQDLMANGIGTPSITFLSCVWDGTRFIATSTTGLVFWSTAGTGSWTLKSCSESATATTSANFWYVNSVYVTGGSTGYIAQSSDCIAWAFKRTAFAWGGTGIAGYINSKWFMFGTAGYYYSADALAWSQYLSGNVSASCSHSGHLTFVNANGVVFTSTDGVTFTPVANQLFATVAGMADDGTNQIAVTSAAVYRSTDNGSTWTQVASQTTIQPFIGSPRCVYDAINSRFVVTGGFGYAIESADGGATWSTITRAAHNFQSICADATIGKTIALCTNGIILTRTTGAWTVSENAMDVGSPVGGAARVAADGSGNVVVCDVNPPDVFYSGDASSWKQKSAPAGGASWAGIEIFLNSTLFFLANGSNTSFGYSKDLSTWFYRGVSQGSSAAQWACYFNSKYIFFASGNIFVWS